jgi:hypothetical protein
MIGTNTFPKIDAPENVADLIIETSTSDGKLLVYLAPLRSVDNFTCQPLDIIASASACAGNM